jgi:hypothetical protein
VARKYTGDVPEFGFGNIQVAEQRLALRDDGLRLSLQPPPYGFPAEA